MFNQYFNNLNQINPANINDCDTIAIGVGNQSFTGDFNNIGGFYANALKRINKKDTVRLQQAIGLNFIGEKEGSVFSNSRFYLGYAVRLKLNTKFQISLGVSAGLFSNTIKGGSNNAGSASNVFDANIGLCISNKYNKFGIALNQFPGSSFTPIVEKLIIERYILGYFQNAQRISVNFEIRSNVLASIQKERLFTPNITEVFVVNDVLSFGISYTFKTQYGFLIGIEKIKIARGLLLPYISYHLPVPNRQIAQNTSVFSIGINYKY